MWVLKYLHSHLILQAEELLSALALNNAALTQEIEALRDATVESKRAMAQVEP